MAEFKNKNKYSFWYAPLTLMVLMGVLIFSVFKVIILIKKKKATTIQKELVLNRMKSLENREDNLNKDINRMQTKEGIESIIREKYQVVKKGEQMVVIVNDNSDSNQQKKIKTTHSFWLWIWIKNIFKK